MGNEQKDYFLKKIREPDKIKKKTREPDIFVHNRRLLMLLHILYSNF